MPEDCGCGNSQGSASGLQLAGDEQAPNLEPPSETVNSSGGASMTESVPTLAPPEAVDAAAAAADAAPNLLPSGEVVTSEGGITGTVSNKRVNALWGINQNRNSWVHIVGVGWKKLANNSDSAVVALTLLAAHAKQTQTNYTYREESDGMIHESYVW